MTVERPTPRDRSLGRVLGVGILGAVACFGASVAVSQVTGLAQGASTTAVLVALAAVLWVTEAVPLFATSFIILALELAWLLPILPDHDQAVSAERFLAPFFSNVILLFLGGFVLSSAFRKYELDQRIAAWVLARTGGHPARVLAAVIAVAAVLSMWMSNTATAAMMLGLAMPMLAGVPERDPYRRALPLGIAFGANLGGLGTPIGTPPNAIAIEAMKRNGDAPSFLQWMLMAMPILTVLLIATWFVLMRMYPTTVQQVTMEAPVSRETPPAARLVIAVTLATALLWLTGGLHPLATGTVALLPVVVFFAARILDRGDFQRLPWDVLMLAGGGMSLGAAVELSGLGQAIVGIIPVGELGLLTLMGALSVVAAVMTTFMSNTATANLLVPVVAGLPGGGTAALLTAVAFTCSCTMVLPVSTPPNAMVFSSGYLQTPQLVRPALVLSGLALVLNITLAPLWWSVFMP